MTEEEKTNRFVPSLTIKSRRFRYADLILFGQERRLERKKQEGNETQ